MSKKKPAPQTPPESVATALNLPPCGADAHAHLDDKRFDADREEVLARARACGIAHIVNVFTGLEEYTQRRDVFRAHPDVAFTLGIHPCDGLTCTADALAAMRAAFAADARIKAVGEIGLDYYWDDCPRDAQHRAFVQQLELARELGKPVVIHCREAQHDTLELLEGNGMREYPLLWHCFGGDAALAARIIDNGWHISVPGPVTYPANTAQREALCRVPLDRLHIETDCPYLAPQDWRGRRNEPAFTVFTAACVAAARNLPPADLWEQCGKNTARFFGLAPAGA